MQESTRRLSDTRSGLLGRRSPHRDLLGRGFPRPRPCPARPVPMTTVGRARPHASAHIARRRRRSIEAWARVVGDQAWSQMRVHMWNPVRDAVATTPDWGRSHYKVNERTEVHRQSKTLWLAIGLRAPN